MDFERLKRKNDPIVYRTVLARFLPSDTTKTYKIGGGWGDAINWIDLGKRVVGWKSRKPRKGDLLKVEMESGRVGIYIFATIKTFSDPPDMFAGDVVFKEYEDSAR